MRLLHPSLLRPGSPHKVRSYRAMRPQNSPYKVGPGLISSVLDMSCDCSELQAQRIECDYCNPQSCVCQEGEPDICIFCEREFIYLQSENDRSTVVSDEDCSSLSSRAGANSCIQSPQQYHGLSTAFGDTVQIVHSGHDALLCSGPQEDPGEGPSGIQGDVSRPRTDKDWGSRGGRTSTPDPIKCKLQAHEDSSDRSYEVQGTGSNKDSHSEQRRKRSRSISKQRQPSPISRRRDSRSLSSSSSISSGSSRSSSSSCGSSCVEEQQDMVHANGRQPTPELGKRPKDKGRTKRDGSPTHPKKIKSIPDHSENKEGQRKSVYYWSYYKCPPADTSADGSGQHMGGRPGIDPDTKRLRGASRTPRFILADHTGDEYPHCHILLDCSAGGGTRGLRRCLAFLQATPIQIAEATANLQRVVLIEKCVAYMGKYGPDTIFFYGKGWDVLKKMIHETDGVAGPCHAFEKARNEQKSKLINSNLSKRNMMDDVRDHIMGSQTPPYQAKRFIDRLNYDQKLQFMTMYGQDSWKRWINSVVEAMNTDFNRDQPQKMLQTWFDIHTSAGSFTPNIPEVNQWWSNLFDMNMINPIEFLTKFFAIGDKRDHKKNAFILQGPTNCGKSMLFRLLTEGMSITPMTRDNGKNAFWLQSCLDDKFILYEEPMIAPENVNTWKLLLEGAPVKAQIKNQPDAIMERKPFFITTNDNIGTWINQTDRDALATRSHTFHVYQQISNPPSVLGAIPEPPVIFNGTHLFAFFAHILGIERMQAARERGHL